MQASVRDEHIQREIWNGAVPIEINLAKNESLGCKSTPEAYYLLAQRNGYLALLSDEIKQHFLQFFNEGDIDDDIVWFSYGDAPLKWHFPTGVLFDMFDRQQDIPWKIEAHFKNFPSDQIIDYSLTEALKSHYMNNLKEANYLKGGANSKINLLSKEEQNNLWDGLKESNYDKFWGTHQILSLETKDLRYVPIRILTHDKKIIQDPIYAYNGQDEENTLLDVLQEHAVNYFPKNTDQYDYKVYVHGISPPMETPITWLAYHCCHPDNFLYICIIANS